jgi:hypothetical protein
MIDKKSMDYLEDIHATIIRGNAREETYFPQGTICHTNRKDTN